MTSKKAEKHSNNAFPNFSECDRCVLKLLRPQLVQEDDTISECSQIQQLLRQFKQALNQWSIISLTNDGTVQFMTQRAEQLLNQYFLLCPPDSLPAPLHQWFKHHISQLTLNGAVPHACSPLRIEQSEQQLIIWLIPDAIGGQHLLLLEEHQPQSFSVATLELLGLTKREAEVLFWIAQDKSNAGIAKALGCCEGTIRKHLENLYKKLGVQTRIAAVMVALERLGLIKA